MIPRLAPNRHIALGLSGTGTVSLKTGTAIVSRHRYQRARDH
jgi:hypothetical protein